MTPSQKTTVTNLIAKGETEKAIQALLACGLPPAKMTEATQIAASHALLRKKSIIGTLSHDQLRIGFNQINERILLLLQDDYEPGAVSKPARIRQHLWKYVVGLGVLIGILGGIAEFSGWNLRDIFGAAATDEVFTVTVFVHGKKGRDDRILKNQGQVMLALRTNEMPGSINEKGEATFKEIPGSFNGKKVHLRIEHPQPYRATQPDSLYLLEPNAAIYVEVGLEGMHRIFGTVMDFETELWADSVRVSIENFATYTDEFGWFELYIPETKQQKFQRVSFFKPGYQIEELDSIPVHTQQAIQTSLKKR